jgi:acetolactate decarboxylase
MSSEVGHPWLRSMLDHLRPAAGPNPDTLFQTSTMAALLAGVFDGTTTVAELLRHGDFGVGTFDQLDGEMVVVDGVCHRLRSDGSVTTAGPSDRTPFAAVAFFRPTVSVTVAHPLGSTDVHDVITRHVESRNLPHAVRVTGTFAEVLTRTVSKQTPPYPTLTDVAAAGQRINRFTDVDGDLLGFLTPSYESGVSVPGEHLHFVDGPRARGGHALGYTIAGATITIATLRELHLHLPDSAAFRSADMDVPDLRARIAAVEGDGTT